VLLERLHRLDPVGAARIDGRNTRRVIRALEVTLALGVPFSSLQRKANRYRSLLLVLQAERSLLYARADRRLESMVQAGFVDEVRTLLAAGYAADLPAFSALGYREIADALLGSSSLAAALEATRGHTHDFIRRQLTWFRAERAAVPLSIERADVASDVVDLARRWLAGDEPLTPASVAHA
jgi:tRNA dimethylallyltransferase